MERDKNGFYHELLNVLKQDSGKRFYAENGDLLRNKVAECAMNLDNELIKLLLSNEKIKSRFFRSFLEYLPYGVLTAMVFPAVLYCTANFYSALVGMIVAIILSLFKRGLLTVALSATATVFLVELIMRLA